MTLNQIRTAFWITFWITAALGLTAEVYNMQWGLAMASAGVAAFWLYAWKKASVRLQNN